MCHPVCLRQVYADYESNPLLRRGIEFCCRQFYILHRKPFVLQLFASVAPLLEFTVRLDTHTVYIPINWILNKRAAFCLYLRF